ncbi:MAG TPA: hypothetical protein PLD83_04590 [Oscillospiraceae bacterium]|nr:hypothetical protein [Oscillospiraceae bacterium]HNY00621.1 hypothetical protein [Oscillospiraceae bacterium]HPS75697.1 hypothetical protein [Oscillospiraceae bacterium]
MREKMARFMAGRYGGDQLNRFVAVSGCVLILVGFFVGGVVSLLLYFVSLAGLVWSYYRMFSRNFDKRRQENARYLRFKQRMNSDVRLNKERWSQRRDYKFFTCPACHTTLRVPKGKGKINIVCRKCGNSFQGKT